MNKLLDSYKAEAIEYRMYFAKAHPHEIDWLKKYLVKNPPFLPDLVPGSKEEMRRILDEQLDTLAAYEMWAGSANGRDEMPGKLKQAIIKIFGLD